MKVFNKVLMELIIAAPLLLITFMGSKALSDCSGQYGPPPAIETFKSVDPTIIYIEGGGIPDETTVELTVLGTGTPNINTDSIDVVLVMDRSGSMAGQKLDDAKSAAIYFCTLLDFYTDQSSLVSFSSTATLDQLLTSDHNLTISAIQGLFAGGGTAIGDGINIAQWEFNSGWHRFESAPIMVVLSDGENSGGLDPVTEANIAKSQGTTIFAIGLGPLVNETLMRQIASVPDSEYYFYAPTSSDLDSIYGRVHENISNFVSRRTFAKEILAPNIHFVSGSYSIVPISVSGDTAVWYLGDLEFGESWTVTFNITSTDTGHLPVDDFPNAEVNFINYCFELPDSVPFPQAYIDVLAPLVGVEEEQRGRDGENSDIRLIPNPFSTSPSIRYSLPENSHVALEIYNLAGGLVRTLVSKEMESGTHIVNWDRRDDRGLEVSTGVYILRMKTGDLTRSQKIVLLR